MFNKFNENDLLTKLIIKANKTVLREFIDLINRLNFEFSKIIALKQYSRSTTAIINLN